MSASDTHRLARRLLGDTLHCTRARPSRAAAQQRRGTSRWPARAGSRRDDRAAGETRQQEADRDCASNEMRNHLLRRLRVRRSRRLGRRDGGLFASWPFLPLNGLRRRRCDVRRRNWRRRGDWRRGDWRRGDWRQLATGDFATIGARDDGRRNDGGRRDRRRGRPRRHDLGLHGMWGRRWRDQRWRRRRDWCRQEKQALVQARARRGCVNGRMCR